MQRRRFLSRVSRPLKRIGKPPPNVGVENADAVTAVVVVDLIAYDLLEAREACGARARGVNAPLPAVVRVAGVSRLADLDQTKRAVSGIERCLDLRLAPLSRNRPPDSNVNGNMHNRPVLARVGRSRQAFTRHLRYACRQRPFVSHAWIIDVARGRKRRFRSNL